MAINKKKMIELLNEDLSMELGAMITYLTFSAKVTGPYRPELSKFFAGEVTGEQAHAQFLANKIVALGGEPTTVARAVPPAHTNKEMLMAVLESERKAVADYTERARQAEKLGDKALQVQLENIIADESGHVDETARILKEWPL